MNRRGALVSLGAAAAQTILPIAARSADAIRVNELPFDGTLQVTYAMDQGFASQAGLNVDISMISNGEASMAAVIGGAVDIGNANVFSILAAHERGVPIVILAPSTIYTSKAPSAFLMVPKDSSVQNARDLNGKTLAINGLKGLDQYSALAWTDKNGGDSQSLRFVEMPIADMALALASHRVDAAIISQPFASSAAEARVLSSPYDGIAPAFLIGCWTATREWSVAHPAIVTSFAKMIYKTGVWANANRDVTANTLIRVTKVDPARMKLLPRATFTERYSPAIIQPIIDVALKYGAITKRVRPEDIIAPKMPWNA